ncbi:M23 family metallopeptidase [Planococcus halotolerans]|uniref:M23 family metallopeptidase n=1 Tax=Planococcus halotolerans TaxID=2233542 RepID=UPI0023EEF7C5|nr:M23 family metallopeptidase [Planococcus halotolerans]
MNTNPASAATMSKNNSETVEKEDKILFTGKSQLRQNELVLKGAKALPSVGSGNFVWPAQGGYISSERGPRWGRQHKGIDIAQPDGFDILAADHGVVKAAGADGTFGNRVVIDHGNGYETIYAHLKSMNVKVGDKVPQGTKIGVMGTTGRSTGIHLHFEISKNGATKDPLNYVKQ